MTAPILSTKLYVPSPQPGLVPRPRLRERIRGGPHTKLTLISAPAGFGKTTLISEWAASADHPVAWLSLDALDADLPRFLNYAIAALQTIDSLIGARIIQQAMTDGSMPAEQVLTLLLNDITDFGQPFTLVLDDYHVLDSTSIDEALTFLLEHQPPHMHLIITTREDPALPLARLRVRGHMIELRAADLRFTPDDARAFLNDTMGLNLALDDVMALEQRTEGWIAGLQMAALSMQAYTDKHLFIETFSASHQFVLDYLVEEVLHGQPESVQHFLLYTSILDRLCGDLCDAVMAEESRPGQGVLEQLHAANLFLVPLDNERHWYRYHHLFADLLRQRLRQAGHDADALHLRASQWFEHEGLDLEAFQHAVAANNVEQAGRLMQGEGMPLYFRGAIRPVLHWLESLPPGVLDANPSLWVSYATAATIIGRTISINVEAKLEDVEHVLQAAEPNTRTRDLLGQIAAIRAMLAVPRNRADIIITQSHRALDYLHPDNLPLRTSVTWTLGYAYQIQGDRAMARETYEEVIPVSEASGNTMFTIGALVNMGQIQEADIQLRQAAETYLRVIELAGDPPLPGASEAHFGLARVYYQRNDLDAAGHHIELSLPLAQQMENVDSPGVIELFHARVKLAGDDVKGAAGALEEAEQFFHKRGFEYHNIDVAATRIDILLRQGDLAAAAELAAAHDLPLSQARVHLAHGHPDDALAVLEPYRHEMESKGWKDEFLKALVLQAVVLHTFNEHEQALQVLSDALALAAPEGFIRLFIDEGPPMAELLTVAAGSGIMPEYTTQLLRALGDEHPCIDNQPLAEPLTERELEVLQLIEEGLSNRQISERLYLALDTVKGHNRRIYAKLEVQRRTEAVARARELGLI